MEQVNSGQSRRCRYASTRLLCLLPILMLLAAWSHSPLPSPAEEQPEYQVKAQFVWRFSEFVEWPASAFESPGSWFSICILGDDPFGSTLDQTVAGEVMGGRRITVQRIKHAPPPQSCQILFVSRSEKDVSTLLQGLGPGVLTVGEGESFVRDGGMIAFAIENRRVRFDINQAAAEHAGLKLSSQLLKVARVVKK